MPPKPKYTREEIINTALEMTRKKGIHSVVARELGKKLGTSSSPIFTAFKNMEELQNEIKKAAMNEFEAYVCDAVNYTPAFKYVGIKMIEFAIKEPNLFQLLFMSEHDEKQTYSMLIDELGDTVEACLNYIQKDYELTRQSAEFLFRQVWLHTFGICVLVSGRICQISPEEISEMMSAELQGTLMLIKSGKIKNGGGIRIDK